MQHIPKKLNWGMFTTVFTSLVFLATFTKHLETEDINGWRFVVVKTIQGFCCYICCFVTYQTFLMEQMTRL